nr:formylglycine-generating enzyme family protein [Bacteroidales bacterium]
VYGDDLEINPAGPEKTEERVYRNTKERRGINPTAKAKSLGFRVALNTNKPVAEAIKDVIVSGKAEREEGERKTETIKVGNASYKMVLVKGGSFDMGGTSDQYKYAKDDEKPVHKVTLSDYEIGETEVTVALWNAVMGSLPRYNDAKKDADKAVCNISWYDAQHFILKLNKLTGRSFRLPTEAEWEFAARGRVSNYNRYAGSDEISLVAWYGENSNKEIHPAKGKKANQIGLYDMSGNVWEWCQDWTAPYGSEDVTDPTGPETGKMKVTRGGSCESPWSACRNSNRQSIPPSNIKKSFGFRLAL